MARTKRTLENFKLAVANACKVTKGMKDKTFTDEELQSAYDAGQSAREFINNAQQII